ncbi:septum formation initiator family protein [uncultured Catenibacterium sp.]|uniref:septum formation initiator family protein n=1 Tax=uncultured Catenibacterium sp. TaxID=286142 RepID=UPI0025F7AED9|nr:septum formation initiator family protein [uncultured Catenibacterium sp.]
MAKKKRKMGNIYGIVFIVISVFLMYTLVAKVQHIQAEQATYQKLIVQEKELKKEKEKLAKEVDSLNDSDYVVRYARSHYIFSKNGEEVIILPENK